VAWTVAATVGAPLSDSLRGIADALRDAEQARDDVAVALAEPATTARLIAWLPLLAVALVAGFGFDVLSTLTHPVGVACLVLGVLLMIGARRWTGALVRRAQPEPGVAGWECDVMAIALRGGVSIERALEVVADAGCPGARAETAGILAARTEGRLRAARLSGRLLIPLGVCTLPSFLLLGVAPMLLSVLSTAPIVF
jgi:tight adherence protein B